MTRLPLEGLHDGLDPFRGAVHDGVRFEQVPAAALFVMTESCFAAASTVNMPQYS